MHIQLNPAPRRIAGHLRFTSNVLRSLGVLNDVICFFVAFLLAQIFYDLTIGYYYDTQVHSSAAAILCLNYFLIRVSRDGYSTFLGHGSDLGGGAIAEFLLASALTSLVIIQLNMLGEFSRGVALFFIGHKRNDLYPFFTCFFDSLMELFQSFRIVFRGSIHPQKE